MTPRRRARCVAMQVLYALDGAVPPDPAQTLATHVHQFGVPEEETDLTPEPVSGHQIDDPPAPAAPFDDELALDLIRGVCTYRGEIDDVLGKLSRKWRVERLARVDRTILRMGVYELGHRKDTPARVALSEAIELAKRFGAEEAPAFINGLLDSALELLGQRP
ncbi:MAG: transcription antitermination factor NusB [Polyangia bacterium]